MSDVNLDTWKERCLKWSDCSNLTWSEKIVIDNLAVAVLDGAVGNRVHRQHIQKQIKKLSKEEEKKLITVIVKLHGEEYKQTKEVKEGIEITVEDVQFIIQEVKGITIQVLKG